MPWGINDGDIVFCGLELPQSNINGDTTFSLGLQFVQHPGILEGTFAHLENNISWLQLNAMYKTDEEQAANRPGLKQIRLLPSQNRHENNEIK